jgi:hypothetical protein
MGKILDKHGDMETIFHYDEADKKVHIQTKQDCSTIIDMNTKQRNASSESWKGDMHHVGRIPMVVIEQLNKRYKCNVLAPENRHLLMSALRSSEFTKLRTKSGKI